jgi:hypothetical protein
VTSLSPDEERQGSNLEILYTEQRASHSLIASDKSHNYMQPAQ